MQNASYGRHRFPPQIIQHVIWRYFRIPLGYRDVEDVLAEPGVDVGYQTVLLEPPSSNLQLRSALVRLTAPYEGCLSLDVAEPKAQLFCL